jgi:hypothetical protein
MRRVQKALTVTTDIDAGRVRRRLLLVLARITAMILFMIVVFRILVPYLFDLHTNLGLVSAVVAALLGFGALIWFVFDFISSLRPIRRT